MLPSNTQVCAHALSHVNSIKQAMDISLTGVSSRPQLSLRYAIALTVSDGAAAAPAPILPLLHRTSRSQKGRLSNSSERVLQAWTTLSSSVAVSTSYVSCAIPDPSLRDQSCLLPFERWGWSTSLPRLRNESLLSARVFGRNHPHQDRISKRWCFRYSHQRGVLHQRQSHLRHSSSGRTAAHDHVLNA